jgi:ribosomal-protein-alanine N-acetyltransferase
VPDLFVSGLFAGVIGGRRPCIETERLVLRLPRRRDVGVLDAAIAETLAELVEWLPWAHPSHSRTDSRQYLRHTRITFRDRSAIELAICCRKTGELVGMASLHRIDWTRACAGLGYWVRRSKWACGYATEGAGALVRYGLTQLSLHRVEAHVATGNAASQRVVEKLGFQREGVARAIEQINGRYLDHIQYSLLRDDHAGECA